MSQERITSLSMTIGESIDALAGDDNEEGAQILRELLGRYPDDAMILFTVDMKGIYDQEVVNLYKKVDGDIARFRQAVIDY